MYGGKREKRSRVNKTNACQSWLFWLFLQDWVCVPVLAVLPGLGVCASPGCSSRTGCVRRSWLFFQGWVCVPVLAVLPGLGVCASPGCSPRTGCVRRSWLFFQGWVCVPVCASKESLQNHTTMCVNRHFMLDDSLGSHFSDRTPST